MKKIFFLFLSFFLNSFFLTINHIQAQNKKVLDSLNGIYQNAKHDTIKIMALNSIAYEYRNNNPDTCIILAKQALEKSEKTGFQKGKGWAINRVGMGNRTKGKYPEAIDFFQKTLPIFEKINDKKGTSSTFNMMGLVYQNQSDYPTALEYYQKSLKIAEKIEDKQGIGIVSANIAHIYTIQNNRVLGLEYYQKSLKIREDIGDKYGISLLLNDIGVIYYLEGNLYDALSAYQKSLRITEEINDKQIMSYALNNMGDVYKKQNKPLLALEYYQKSLKIKEKIGDKWAITYSLKGIAEVYQQQKNYEKSIEYAKKSLRIAQEIKASKEMGEASKILFETYKRKGDYFNALTYHELWKKTNDSTFNIDKSKALANLETKAKIEKQQIKIEKQQVEISKEKEAKEFQQYITYLILLGFLVVLVFAYFIFKSRQKEKKAKELISIQREKLAIQAKQLTEANNSKDKLFAILGHDLRSPVNSLESFLGLMQMGFISIEEFETHLPTFYNNVKNLQNTLSNLLQWSVSQMNGIKAEPTQVNTKQIINEHINLFNTVATAKNITIIANIPENIYVWADENHFQLLLRNLINNALKFTHKGGKITISVAQNQTDIEIRIADNGVGMTTEQTDKLFKKNQNFTTYGTSGEKGTGLGLQLCQEIVEKNNGKIWVESIINKGSTFIFTLPKNNQQK